MSERRVIFVNRVYWPDESATAQLLADLAPALAGRGWTVHVITGGEGPAEHDGVRVHRTGGPNSVAGLAARVGAYLRFLRESRRLLRGLLRPGDLLVVKTDPPLLSVWLTSAARRRGAVVCQWLQDIYPEIVPAHKGRWLEPLLAPLRAWRNSAWHRSARVLVVGEDMAAAVRRAGVAEQRILHFPNWAPRELEQRATRAAAQAERDAWGVGAQLAVVYSGNLGRVHDFATLLDAAQLLRDRPDIAFVIIGRGPRLAEVRANAAARSLTNMRFLPATPRERLGAALGAADVHLVTLRPGFEQLVHPSKLAGILASGRPAVFVGPPHSAIAGFLAEGRCGSTVAAGDPEQLAALLRQLADAPENRAALGVAARTAYERHYRHATAVGRWDELLRALAKESTLP